MRHLKSGRKLGRTWSHRKALLGNLATSLIVHDSKSIRTTLAKAKELRPFIEKLITKAKHAYARERSGVLPDGHVDVHQRREVGRVIHDKGALQELFDVIAPAVAERNGGYTRIIKLGQRRGDGAEEAIIQLVDWSAQQDGNVSLRDKKKKPARKARPAAPKAQAAAVVAESAPVVEAPAVEEVEAEPTAVNSQVTDAVASAEEVVDNATEAAPEADNSGEATPDEEGEKNA